MTLEEILFDCLKGLVGNRVFPDVAPEKTDLPYIAYTSPGGEPVNFLEGGMPSKANTRMQISVWAATRMQASAVARQAEAALRLRTELSATVLGQPASLWDPATGYRGAAQDFSLWSNT